MAHEVRRNDERSQYELFDDGTLIGLAVYEERDGVHLIPHTEIQALRRGQGLGDVLVRGVLDDLRTRGSKVVPGCWFVRDFIERHPDDADLLP